MLKKAKYKIYKNEDYIVEVQKRETDETQVDFGYITFIMEQNC